MRLHAGSLALFLCAVASAPGAVPVTVGANVQVSRARDGIAVPEILGADNGLPAAGAVWDFSPQLPDGRLAGQSTRARRVRFLLNQLGAFRLDPRGGLGSLLSVETKALGKEESR